MQLSHAISRLKEYNIKHRLFGDHARILLAVSGGRDSMCMLALFEQTDQPFGVAHMNYQLRGEESDRDAAFVQEYCQKRGIDFHISRVDCRMQMAEHGTGLQVTARNLRYTWLHTLLSEKKYQAFATAHHQDDNVETMLINLMRGTGIQGLTGIPLKRSGVIRPMMCFDSQEIQSITDTRDIQFCLDASNEKDDYLRNRIRHHLIPLMNEIRPGSSRNIMHDIEMIKGQWEGLEAIAIHALANLSKGLDEAGGSILLDALLKIPSSEYILLRIVNGYGFTLEQCANILQSDKASGIGFQSSTHEMILDRDLIRIERRSTTRAAPVRIDIGSKAECSYGQLEITRISRPDQFSTDVNIEYISPDSLQNGGVVRTWKDGDRFFPLGMSGSQKVSDLLTNLKYSTFQKRQVRVLLDGEQIVWVIGIRASEQFKVVSGEKTVLRLVWTPNKDTGDV
ncbi:MAG: tRNA lysidine(34) synthetase TilS [Bacteroidetes bacterium]|nr:MAG: tRNA lysidine(34) synthetase TilS [Bacteroidota bacterium]